jgi:hypothetical protein
MGQTIRMALSDLMLSDVSSVFMNTSDFAVSAVASRDSTSVTFTVIVDQQEMKSTDRSGVSIARNQTMLLVQTSAYALGDGLATPQGHDEFLIGSRRFECRKPSGKDQCWEYMDGTSLMMKIYVEEVS